MNQRAAKIIKYSNEVKILAMAISLTIEIPDFDSYPLHPQIREFLELKEIMAPSPIQQLVFSKYILPEKQSKHESIPSNLFNEE